MVVAHIIYLEQHEIEKIADACRNAMWKKSAMMVVVG